MKLKHSVMIALSGLCVTLSAHAYQQLDIKNNSDGFATAQIGNICSSMLGDQGVISPNASAVVPPVVFDLYCPQNCEVKIFISKTCGGEAIATVDVNHDQGVTHINNHHVNNYYLTGSGKSITIEGKAN